MAEHEVLRYPDTRLKQVCRAVTLGPGGAPLDARRVADALIHTMDAYAGCVGVAAPQLGELVRIIAIDVTGHRRAASCSGRRILVNPRVEAHEGSITMREGCLSIPDFTANVRRPEQIVVSAYGLDGAPVQLKCDAYEARVVLHEIDHLDGMLFLDRVESAREVFPRKRYQ